MSTGEMCGVCNIPLKVVIPGLLLRCPLCGLYKRLHPQEQTPIIAAEPIVVQKTAATRERAFSPVGDDIDTFIERVCERLIPIHPDYTAAIKKKLITARNRYRKQLLDVFNGKTSLENWTNKTRTELALHPITLGKILYESLAGLRSRDAQELRLSFQDYLQRLSTMYQIR